MATDFRGNFIHVRLIGPSKSFRPPWVRDDPRPRCVLVLGDGFTQDFLKHYGLDTVAPSNVAAHFQPPPAKLYLPVPGDLFGPNPSELWDERKWPRLFEAWCAYGHPDDPYGFYQACATERINPTVDQGTWSFNTNTLAYQLRAYLWHFFVSFQRTVDEHMRHRALDSWLWTRLINLLDLDFRLAVVTFNYDLIARRVLSSVVHRGMAYTVEALVPRFEEWPLGAVLLLHAHGSIGEALDQPAPFARGSANPWLECIRIENNLSDLSLTGFYEPPLDHFPLALDLVPPGHQGDDICNPHSRVNQISKELLAVADTVIFCGLSASSPDTAEVAGLVNAIRAGALTVQVGISGRDENNPLAYLLAASKAGRTAFLDARQLLGLRGHLAGRFQLTKNAWDEVCAQTAASTGRPRGAGKPGRNEPCYCGSGKKYKRCCGAL